MRGTDKEDLLLNPAKQDKTRLVINTYKDTGHIRASNLTCEQILLSLWREKLYIYNRG